MSIESSMGKGLHEYKKGQVSFTPEEKARLEKKGIDPDSAKIQATERIRTNKNESESNPEDIVKEIIDSIDMEKYVGFVKIADVASINDREDVANQVLDDINHLSIYGNMTEVLPVLNKLSSIYKYLTGKDF